MMEKEEQLRKERKRLESERLATEARMQEEFNNKIKAMTSALGGKDEEF